ncbi:hypothetical protein [Streptomyces sp. NPDC058955]|uniref:hypothetical protein n=1 Tax=unclassified Streptomyces TaxID=2593676 RepID=UPI00365D1A8D
MNTKRVLVAYVSRHDATAGIADEIGRTLRDDGLDADVLPADAATDVSGYDGVVPGGALYAGRPTPNRTPRRSSATYSACSTNTPTPATPD